LGISVPERQLGMVRTYGDLVGLAARLVAEQSRRTLSTGQSRVVFALTRLLDDVGRPILERSGVITPYDAELIVQHAVGVRRATELHVIVPGDVSGALVGDVDRLFSRLKRLHVRISVLSEDALEPARRGPETFRVPPLAVAAEAAAQARGLLHELQKERAMMALSVGRGWQAAELGDQLARTTRALAEVRAFLASHGTPQGNPTLAELAAAVDLFGGPNERWAIDTTHLFCGRDGWCHLTAIIDCCDRTIVGWRLARSGIAGVAAAALEDALRDRRISHGHETLTVRSDNGLVFGAKVFVSVVRRYGLGQEYITPYSPEQNGKPLHSSSSVRATASHRRTSRTSPPAVRVTPRSVSGTRERRTPRSSGERSGVSYRSRGTALRAGKRPAPSPAIVGAG
jgi:Integrase core domain